MDEKTVDKTVKKIVVILLVVLIIYLLLDSGSERMVNLRDLYPFGSETTKNESRVESGIESRVDYNPAPVERHVSFELTPEQKEEDKYIAEYVNYSRMLDKPIEIESDETKINEFRKSFLDFRNLTNNTTDGFDAVDKVNEEFWRTKGADGRQGMKIADIYDNLTKAPANSFQNNKIDVAPMQYNEKKKASNGEYYQSNVFEYIDDDVNNGGFFYSNIQANDTSVDDRMAL